MGLARIRLEFELQAWRAAGRAASLWWRDDDARASTPALLRLLALSDRYEVPLTLAVIPDGEVETLAGALATRPQITVVQHGVDHRNRRLGAQAGEFPHEWNRWELGERLTSGWTRLASLPAARQIFVPPWNDIHPDLDIALAAQGYLGWSAWGEGERADVPPRVDAHIDVLRWKRGVRFRGQDRIEQLLYDALRERRLAKMWDAPIGFLTHHLDHDAAAWSFLDSFLAWSIVQPTLVWRRLDSLIELRRGLVEQAARRSA